MDLGLLKNSKEIVPLLVRLYDTQRLDDLAKDKGINSRLELVEAVMEILDFKCAEKEAELIADILVTVIRQAEVDLREAVSQKLALRDDVPLRLILQMANDDLSVARPILTKSDILSDQDLIYIIKSKPVEYWSAVAERQKMGEQLQQVLIESGDENVAMTLVENKSIRICEAVMGMLADLACKKTVLATPLLRREEMTKDLAMKLYDFVADEMKQLINSEYGVTGQPAVEEIDLALQDIEIEFEDTEVSNESSADDVLPNDFVPTAVMRKGAERFASKGLLTPHMMLSTLKRGQYKYFVALLSKFSGLGVEETIDLLGQDDGKGLAIICRAHNILKSDFMAFYLLSAKYRKDCVTVDTKCMNKAIACFDKISTEDARRLLSMD